MERRKKMAKKTHLNRRWLIPFLLVLMTGWVFAQEAAIAPAPASGPGQEHVVKVLRTTNKAQVLKYVPRVYSFANVNPHEIVNYFTSALATEEGGAYTFVAPDGASGKILVICPEFQIPYFDKLAKDLDRSKLTSAPGSKYIYYRLKHRSAGDMGLLSVLYSYGGELPVLAPDLTRPGQALQADWDTNSLLLYDAPSGADNAEKVLKEMLDKPTPQVEFQVKIYEVQVNNDGSIGLDYTDWKNGPGALLASEEFGGERLKVFHDTYSNGWTRTGGYYLDYPSAYFDFLVVKNEAKVVAENNITVMSGNPASLSATEKYLYFSKKFIESPNAANPNIPLPPTELYGTSRIPRWNREVDVSSTVDVGTTLNITPTIGEQAVDMNIDLNVNNVTGFADSRDSLGNVIRDVPIVNNRTFKDRITVPLGKEVVISGLTRERVIKNVKKMPFLGDIPVLGWLFSGESERIDKTMVAVVIKPVSIEDMKNYSEESQKIVSKSEGKEKISVPESKIGFDQWLLDSEK
jgi:type II secretory pathway component GspD/PulD (secretin)